MPAFPLALMASSVNAQQYSNQSQSNLRIEGFSVDEIAAIKPGAELGFTISGTPGAIATLRIEGAQRGLTLNEVDAGLYEGTYVIGTHDQVTARSPVTANLRIGNQVVSTVLNESLQRGIGYHPGQKASAIAQPRITSFDVAQGPDLNRGSKLAFTLVATPGGSADLTITGMKGKFLLQETSRGEYTGTYRIRPGDRITPNSVVTANLRIGDQRVAGTLAKSLQGHTQASYRAAPVCDACGTVQAVNAIETKGNGGYLGTIGGGVVGALLGNQVGSGNGRTAATVAGALGGAYAGHAVEGQVRKDVHYEVQVRLQNGGQQTVSFQSNPGYQVGDRVKLQDGGLVRDAG